MNCKECREQLVALIEGLLDEASQSRLRTHLAECSTCLAEFQDVRQLTVQLAGDGLAAPPASLETVVMDRILREQALELRRLKMRKRWRILGISGAMAAAAAMLLVSGLWHAQPAAAENATEVLALGVAPVPEGTIVHIVAKMRTLPHDNFSYIDPNIDFVRVEVWKQLGEKPKWRVEKPGRVAVMDGESTVMLIRPETAVKLPHPSKAAFDTGQLLELATAHDMIGHELQSASAHGGELKIKHETTASGEKKLLATVETKAGVPVADYLKNRFLGTSDLRRAYRFDAKSGRLEGMDAYLHRDGGDVLVLSIESIEYTQHADPAIFSLKLPENVQYAKDPEPLPDNQKYGQMTPKQAAQAFFEACSKGDWGEAQKFYPMPLTDRIKGYLGGLEIVRLGDPFQSAISLLNGDWFVPYEIKLKDGHVKKWNLALRKHRTAKRYLVDGGI
jgi:hypothetical protein